ncbi:hypothetical protein GB928_018305 [Shinella curvata]|uniref:Uncharacterized protein n=1 Tax=Shinella curvata TaxID=1817964 RepID=A0ABT8XHC9_9HYPH|nr:hypothetical protein [Shinella curvata]MCJ8053812.1 hypothetical protein [Shinella curvata]MDO6123144.1 hypothetical protein [Shinella curvata]
MQKTERVTDEMVEGVRIERIPTLEEAMIAAARIASRGPNGEIPVLVLRAENIREKAIEDVLSALTAHELYRYRPKAFHGFIEYARTTLTSDEEASVWRSALVDVPAVASEPVAWISEHELAKLKVRQSATVMPSQDRDDFQRPLVFGDASSRAHPPRSSLIQSEEGEEVGQAMCRLLQQVNRVPTKDVSQRDRDIKTLISALSTRKGSADGSASGTKGVE